LYLKALVEEKGNDLPQTYHNRLGKIYIESLFKLKGKNENYIA